MYRTQDLTGDSLAEIDHEAVVDACPPQPTLEGADDPAFAFVIGRAVVETHQLAQDAHDDIVEVGLVPGVEYVDLVLEHAELVYGCAGARFQQEGLGAVDFLVDVVQGFPLRLLLPSAFVVDDRNRYGVFATVGAATELADGESQAVFAGGVGGQASDFGYVHADLLLCFED